MQGRGLMSEMTGEWRDSTPLRRVTEAIEAARAAGHPDAAIRAVVLANFPGNLVIRLDPREEIR
jgi:hypothetical protein